MPTLSHFMFPLMPRAKDTAGLKLAPEVAPKAKIETINTHAMEVPIQMLPAAERTLHPIVKIKRKVPVNSAINFADIGVSVAMLLNRTDEFTALFFCGRLKV